MKLIDVRKMQSSEVKVVSGSIRMKTSVLNDIKTGILFKNVVQYGDVRKPGTKRSTRRLRGEKWRKKEEI